MQIFFSSYRYLLLSLTGRKKKERKNSLQQKNKLTNTQNIVSSKSNITKEDDVQEAQRSLDKSISILNIIATLIGVLVGLLTLIFVIGGSLGFFEYRRLKEIRQETEKYKEEAKKSAETAKESAEEAKPIVEKLKKTEQEINNMRDQIAPLPLTETPSEELRNKIDDLLEKIKFLEAFGVPLNAEDYFSRSLGFYYKDNFELALKALDKAIELKPDYAEAWINKGIALGELGRCEEALKALDKAIELKPDYAKAWYNKACCYSIKGNKEDTLRDLSKAIDLDAKCKENAKKDEDFKNLWNDEDFKKIVS